MRSLAASLAFVVAVTAVAPVYADAPPAPPSDDVQKAADALFFEGRALLEKKDYAGACAKFEAAKKLRAGIGTLLNLGECSESLGKTATAWAAFRDAMYAAQKVGDDREALARDRMNLLVSKLVKLTIVVPKENAVPGLTIARDGGVVDATLWGTPVPVDPSSSYEVTASAAGYTTWTMKVSVQNADVTVKVPLLLAAKTEPANPGAYYAVTDSASPAEAHLDGGSTSWSTQKTWAIVVGGVGVVGVGLGTMFGFMSKSAHDAAAKECAGDTCKTQSGVDDSNRAISRGNLSTAAFVIGGLGLAAGAVLWFTAPKGHEASVGVAPSPGGASFVGAF